MKIVFTKPFVIPKQRMFVTLPSGLLYLASYLKKSKKPVDTIIFDPDIKTQTIEEYYENIISLKPDILCVTLFSHVVKSTQDMLYYIKSKLPDTIILIGGSHVNGTRNKVFKHIFSADYAICGEGEKPLLEFVNQMIDYGKIKEHDKIPGLIYKNDSGIIVNPNSYTDNLDEFDPVDFNLINIKDYFNSGSPMGLFRKGGNVAQLLTTRGCPFSCIFCASPVNMGKKVRKRSVENIVNEIETLINAGADEIHIMDDNFTFDSSHVISVCKTIIERGIKIRFSMPNGVRLDKLNAEMLDWMRKAGWYHLGFGIEVGSDEALKKIRKGLSMKIIKEKVLLAKNAGMSTAGFFIIGFPFDTKETMLETALTPDRLGLDMGSFGNFTPLPGTEIYEELVKNNEITDAYLPSFASGEVTYTPKGISVAEFTKLHQRIILKYWTHPKRLWIIIKRIKPKDFVFVFRRLLQIFFRPESSDKQNCQTQPEL
ncbi:B12-binding domain-containing radical SAM protein [Candidatus Dependentiae bacterium]|nr:B12-binding domain-containing radical SAM protein [Candidatus Dependentiae bacterium]